MDASSNRAKAGPCSTIRKPLTHASWLTPCRISRPGWLHPRFDVGGRKWSGFPDIVFHGKGWLLPDIRGAKEATMPTVDLNSDLGEGFGTYRCGDDDAMLSIVTSANVACGLHAGDPEVMART